MENVKDILEQISQNTNNIYKLLNTHCKLLEQQNKLFLKYHIQDHLKQQKLEYEIQNLQRTIDKHNSKIFALEFYKNQLFSK